MSAPTLERFDVAATPLAGVWHLRARPLADARGSFARLFCAQEFAALGLTQPLAQINLSQTRARGTVRGLHYQRVPHAEHKLVRCLDGRVLDVVVDLRAGSPTLLQWHAVELDAGRGDALLIPPGCAHGFQALEDDCRLLYLHSAPHAPDAEGGVRFDEPRLLPGPVAWPLPATELSPRDRALPLLTDSFAGLSP